MVEGQPVLDRGQQCVRPHKAPQSWQRSWQVVGFRTTENDVWLLEMVTCATEFSWLLLLLLFRQCCCASRVNVDAFRFLACFVLRSSCCVSRLQL